MSRIAAFAFAVLAYLLFFATFLYLVAFVGDLPWVPVSVDRGPTSPWPLAAVIDLGLIALFGVQHSVMARPWFKKHWTRIIGLVAERSAYVVIASLMLIVLFLGWQPIGGEVWHVRAPWAEWTLWGLFALGWAIVLVSTLLISHFELFGLAQAWLHLHRREPAAPRFHTPMLYKAVRHPLYTGFIIAFWAAPVMTFGHLLLAVAMTAYIVIAIQYEERDLTELFGEDYRDYRTRVGMLVPGVGKSSR